MSPSTAFRGPATPSSLPHDNKQQAFTFRVITLHSPHAVPTPRDDALTLWAGLAAEPGQVSHSLSCQRWHCASPGQCSSHCVLRERDRAWPCLESATRKHRQQLYLKAIIHFLALQSRNISWPGSGLLAYVFYLLSPMHHHLAAVSFGAYFSLQTFKLHNIFLLLSRYKKTSSKWRLYKLETTKSRPLVVC